MRTPKSSEFRVSLPSRSKIIWKTAVGLVEEQGASISRRGQYFSKPSNGNGTPFGTSTRTSVAVTPRRNDDGETTAFVYDPNDFTDELYCTEIAVWIQHHLPDVVFPFSIQQLECSSAKLFAELCNGIVLVKLVLLITGMYVVKTRNSSVGNDKNEVDETQQKRIEKMLALQVHLDATGHGVNTWKAKANIATFLQGCRLLGMQDTTLFDVTDLAADEISNSNNDSDDDSDDDANVPSIQKAREQEAMQQREKGRERKRRVINSLMQLIRVAAKLVDLKPPELLLAELNCEDETDDIYEPDPAFPGTRSYLSSTSSSSTASSSSFSSAGSFSSSSTHKQLELKIPCNSEDDRAFSTPPNSTPSPLAAISPFVSPSSSSTPPSSHSFAGSYLNGHTTAWEKQNRSTPSSDGGAGEGGRGGGGGTGGGMTPTPLSLKVSPVDDDGQKWPVEYVEKKKDEGVGKRPPFRTNTKMPSSAPSSASSSFPAPPRKGLLLQHVHVRPRTGSTPNSAPRRLPSNHQTTSQDGTETDERADNKERPPPKARPVLSRSTPRVKIYDHGDEFTVLENHVTPKIKYENYGDDLYSTVVEKHRTPDVKYEDYGDDLIILETGNTLYEAAKRGSSSTNSSLFRSSSSEKIESVAEPSAQATKAQWAAEKKESIPFDPQQLRFLTNASNNMTVHLSQLVSFFPWVASMVEHPDSLMLANYSNAENALRGDLKEEIEMNLSVFELSLGCVNLPPLPQGLPVSSGRVVVMYGDLLVPPPLEQALPSSSLPTNNINHNSKQQQQGLGNGPSTGQGRPISEDMCVSSPSNGLLSAALPPSPSSSEMKTRQLTPRGVSNPNPSQCVIPPASDVAQNIPVDPSGACPSCKNESISHCKCAAAEDMAKFGFSTDHWPAIFAQQGEYPENYFFQPVVKSSPPLASLPLDLPSVPNTPYLRAKMKAKGLSPVLEGSRSQHDSGGGGRPMLPPLPPTPERVLTQPTTAEKICVALQATAAATKNNQLNLQAVEGEKEEVRSIQEHDFYMNENSCNLTQSEVDGRAVVLEGANGGSLRAAEEQKKTEVDLKKEERGEKVKGGSVCGKVRAAEVFDYIAQTELITQSSRLSSPSFDVRFLLLQADTSSTLKLCIYNLHSPAIENDNEQLVAYCLVTMAQVQQAFALGQSKLMIPLSSDKPEVQRELEELGSCLWITIKRNSSFMLLGVENPEVDFGLTKAELLALKRNVFDVILRDEALRASCPLGESPQEKKGKSSKYHNRNNDSSGNLYLDSSASFSSSSSLSSSASMSSSSSSSSRHDRSAPQHRKVLAKERCISKRMFGQAISENATVRSFMLAPEQELFDAMFMRNLMNDEPMDFLMFASWFSKHWQRREDERVRKPTWQEKFIALGWTTAAELEQASVVFKHCQSVLKRVSLRRLGRMIHSDPLLRKFLFNRPANDRIPCIRKSDVASTNCLVFAQFVCWFIDLKGYPVSLVPEQLLSTTNIMGGVEEEIGGDNTQPPPCYSKPMLSFHQPSTPPTNTTASAPCSTTATTTATGRTSSLVSSADYQGEPRRLAQEKTEEQTNYSYFPYFANEFDPLDVALADVVNGMQRNIKIQRVRVRKSNSNNKLSPAQLRDQRRNGQYMIGQERFHVHLHSKRMVLVRVGNRWDKLEAYIERWLLQEENKNND